MDKRAGTQDQQDLANIMARRDVFTEIRDHQRPLGQWFGGDKRAKDEQEKSKAYLGRIIAGDAVYAQADALFDNLLQKARESGVDWSKESKGWRGQSPEEAFVESYMSTEAGLMGSKGKWQPRDHYASQSVKDLEKSTNALAAAIHAGPKETDIWEGRKNASALKSVRLVRWDNSDVVDDRAALSEDPAGAALAKISAGFGQALAAKAAPGLAGQGELRQKLDSRRAAQEQQAPAPDKGMSI